MTTDLYRPPSRTRLAVIGIAVALMVLGVVYGASALMDSVTASPSLCEAMTDGPSAATTELSIAIEAVSNSEAAANEASATVLELAQPLATETLASLDDASGPVHSLKITVQLFVGGIEVGLVAGPCPGGGWTLAADPGDAEIWADSTDDYKEQLLADYGRHRDEQLAVIADTVRASIAGLDFAAHDIADPGQLTVSPLPILNDIATSTSASSRNAQRTVAVLAPWFSNSGDCLDTSTVPDLDLTVDQIIELCVADAQIPNGIDADGVSFSVYASAHETDATLGHSSDLAAAIQNHITKEP